MLLVKVAVTDGPSRQRQLRGEGRPTGAVCSINRARKSHSFGGTGKVSKKEKSKKIRGFFKEQSLMNAQELEHLLGEYIQTKDKCRALPPRSKGRKLMKRRYQALERKIMLKLPDEFSSSRPNPNQRTQRPRKAYQGIHRGIAPKGSKSSRSSAACRTSSEDYRRTGS